MKTYLLKPGTRQAIAKAGETGVAVAYNAKDWLDDYPAGIPQLMVARPDGVRVPVTVTKEDDLITGQVPDELLVNPGLYSYVFVWTSGTTQLESGRCECVVLGSELAKTWADVRRAPDWAERIFLAAEAIEGAFNGAMEARNSVADNAAAAQSSKEAAEAAADRAEEVKDSIPDDYTEISDSVDYLKAETITAENSFYDPFSPIFELTDIESGAWDNNGVKITDATRLRSALKTRVRKGMTINAQSDTLELYIRQYGEDGVIWFSDWLNVENEKVISLDYDGSVVFLFRKGSDTLTPEDYDGTITISDTRTIYKHQNALGHYYPEQFVLPTDTDDTASIRKALTAAGNDGTVIFQPNKTYMISGTIDITKRNTKLFSLTGGAHSPVIKASNSMTGWMFNIAATGASFYNLTIEGNYATHGLQFKRTDTTGDALADVDAIVDKCYLRNQTNGIAVYGRNVKITECNFSGCKYGAILKELTYQDNGTSMFSRIRGIIVQNCRFHGMGQHWYMDDWDENVFESIDDISGHESWCIRNDATHARQSDNVYAGNLIDGAGFAGFYHGQPDGMNIVNNVMSGDLYCAILCYLYGGATSGMERGIVQNNILSSQRSTKFSGDQHAATIGNATPIYVDDGASVIISNNTATDYGSAGVYIQGGGNVTVIDNVFDGICFDTQLGAIYCDENENENLALRIARNMFIREPNRTGSVSIVNDTTNVETGVSKYNCTENVTDNIT